MHISFATGNSYKFHEVESYLRKYVPHVILRQLRIDIPEIQGEDAEAILRAKIAYVTHLTEGPFLVDDASFLTERYEGFPGPYAKFINRTLGYSGWAKLFTEGDPIKAIALLGLHADGVTCVFKGELDGILSFKNANISDVRAPLNDMVFIPECGLFLGEAMEGNYENHRIKALRKLTEHIAMNSPILASSREA